ncbi:MAG TPA: heavy metal translocating P-type ATPase [Candidatus Thermoplasmatota archaeon]|nr:heavy metal translocating P-type ATPase [Candidatus Thermoplasmatota archaeon]
MRASPVTACAVLALSTGAVAWLLQRPGDVPGPLPALLAVAGSVAGAAALLSTRRHAGTMLLLASAALALGTASTDALWPDALPLAAGAAAWLAAAPLALGAAAAAHAIDANARRGAPDAPALARLAPEAVRVLRDGTERFVSAAELAVDDRMIVAEGERLAADGVVARGTGSVETAHLTGEPLPADVGEGDAVPAGGLVVQGRLVVRATRTGAETSLGRILASLEESAAPPFAGSGEATAARMVPLVLAAAAGAAVVSHLTLAPLAAPLPLLLAVLLAGAPASLPLAVRPALHGARLAARVRGALVKDAQALERLARVQTIVFDKTGTLTQGRLALAHVEGLAKNQEEILALAAAAEAHNGHLLARAVVAAAADRRIEPARVTDARTLASVGVEATFEGRELLVGSAKLLRSRRVDIERALARWDELQSKGFTTVGVSVGGTLVGLLAFSDPLRPESGEAAARLRELGVECAIVTGDHVRTAEAAARELGLRRVFAEITPQGKAGAVRGLQEGGRVVAVVGDGVNDAPALAAADVGIAMGSGAQVAVEEAGVVLLRPDVRLVPELVSLARLRMERARSSLRLAIAFLAVAMALAAAGLLPLVLAGPVAALAAAPALLFSRTG